MKTIFIKTIFFLFGAFFLNTTAYSNIYSKKYLVCNLLQSSFFDELLVKSFDKLDIDVSRFGAKGDGKVDDTDAIQKAIDFAVLSKQSTVSFPNGRYRLSKRSIVVKQGILLKGIDKIPAKSGIGSNLCQFEITFGAGDINIPAFIMESFSGIVGFSFLYPDQSINFKIPISYGWTITSNGKASQDGITLRNLMLTNSYLGIKFDNGGQHVIENIFGQPLKIGIYVDRQYDVLTVNNIHFWPFFSQPGQPLYNWVEANGDAIVLNKTDGLQGNNWFAYGYRRGLYLTNQGNGSAWLTASNVLFDVCKEPIVIDAVSYLTLNNVTLTGTNVAVSQVGLLITEKVKDLNSIIHITGLVAVNFINSLVNKGICTLNLSMKSKIYDGKNNGVRWFDIINENDEALINVTIPLRAGDDYRRISGKMQINGAYTYQKLVDITPDSFTDVFKWSDSKGRIKSIPNGSRFSLMGDICVTSYLLPSNVRSTAGVYVLEMSLKEHNDSGQLGLALFYSRIRDYPNGIDYSIFPHIADPYFQSQTILRIPFVINGGNINLDFVFGRANNTKDAYIDITGMKLYKAFGTQEAYKEIMPKHQNFDRK